MEKENKKVNSKVWFIGAGIIILAIIAVITSVINGGANQAKNIIAPENISSATSSPETATSSAEKANEITREAITQGSGVEGCQKIAADAPRAACEMNVITQEAKDKSEIGVCSKISNPDFKEGCEDQYYTYQAITSQKVGPCAKVKNEIRRLQCKNYVNPPANEVN